MNKPHIQVIVGTTRPGRVGRKIADWYLQAAQQRTDMTFELIDLAEIDLPLLDESHSAKSGHYEHEHTKKWSERITKADGYVWVTGEYNHGVPAPLKNALDYLYSEWNRKPVAFVGYGGLGAARAVEQLVSIASELKMAPLGERVSIVDVWFALDEQGTVKQEFVKSDLTHQFDELSWWAQALKAAREAEYSDESTSQQLVATSV